MLIIFVFSVYNDIDASPVAKLNRKKALLRSKILANRISQDEDYPEGVMGLGYKGLNVLGWKKKIQTQTRTQT